MILFRIWLCPQNNHSLDNEKKEKVNDGSYYCRTQNSGAPRSISAGRKSLLLFADMYHVDKAKAMLTRLYFVSHHLNGTKVLHIRRYPHTFGIHRTVLHELTDRGFVSALTR